MEEHRTEPRRHVLKHGRIAFNNHCSVIDCVLVDVSPHGACLEVAGQLGIPHDFDLFIGADHTPKPAHVVWRRGNHLGIEFD